MEHHSNASDRLTGLPIEIMLEVYRHLDIDSIVTLSSVSQFFHDLLEHRKGAILIPILTQEFSPFDELLQVYTATADDLSSTSGGLYHPRRVIFKHNAGDNGTILAPVSRYSLESMQPGNGFTKVLKGGRQETSGSGPKTVVLTDKDIGSILRYCRTVRKWEELFPQMRWYYVPEYCRSLRPHEQERFRRAFYRWWLYGIYFHGDLPRPRVALPEPQVDDIRTSIMRRYPTSELLELMDLVETMKDVVLNYICPRLDPNQQHASSMHYPALIETVDRAQSLSDGWKDQSRWGRIVKTYAKLGPRELLYYFENIYSYPRKRLLSEIRLRYPQFTFDQESIQVAVRCALDERLWLVHVPSLAEDSCGGILDFDDERDEERMRLASDASPDGSLPGDFKFARSFSHYSPRGDDGSYLEEDIQYRQMTADGQSLLWSSMGTVVPGG